jgi:hypothetical protein
MSLTQCLYCGVVVASLCSFGQIPGHAANLPAARTFASADGSTLLRVLPDIDESGKCTGRVYRLGDEGKEQVLWETKLVVCPSRAFVSSSGEVATVENREHQWGDHAVVVYNAEGAVQADLALNRFFGHQEIWDRTSFGKVIPQEWRRSWTGVCQFAVDDERHEFLVTPPSERTRRISFENGKVRFGKAGEKLLPPQITFLRATSENGGSLEFDAMNPNDEPLFYYGYTRNSFTPPIPAGRMYPLCRFEIQEAAGGEWKNLDSGYCKTGQGEVFIPGRSTQTFAVAPHRRDWHAIRIGVRWHNNEEEEWGTEIQWSEPVANHQLK